ncbi:hypothetical protein GCM10023168_29510 [Fodinibacter luteus]|uniref:ASCH domain-containing protein n=1 Tax=Fodinibacter luteus TaxID=552064 RepID=A0ABP8KMF2_9MICO
MTQLPDAAYRLEVMFSRDLRDVVARGDVTVSIRLWSRAQVKVGGRYAAAGTIIEVDSLEVLPFSAVTEDDVVAAGETDREALRVRAAHSGPIDDDTLVYRVEFHVV